ncbi:MAG: enolase C-terminal domain-like protein [Bryobacteraceae bacterium]
MRIRSIETIPIRVPLHQGRAIRGSAGAHTVSPFLLVKVHTDEGLIGLGEVSCTPRWSGEDQVTAAHLIHAYFEPLWAGEDPRNVDALSRKLRLGAAGNFFTKAALEMALWDILGKVAGLPVYRLLGGAVRDHIPTKFSVSGVEPEQAAEIAGWAWEQGFRAMKVKVGTGEDVKRVEAVRNAVPLIPGVDANGGWDVPTALDRVARMGEIAFVEQPVPPGDIARMAAVKRAVRVPVVADESLYTPQDALALLSGQAADVFSIYVGKSGGIGNARQIAAIAEAAGIPCAIGSNLELGVGSAAMLHLAAATAAVTWPCDILTPFFYEDDILAVPLDIRGGVAFVPDGPGLGVSLDAEKIERFRVDK